VNELIPRRLRLQLPEGQSAFLWGPRKTGKTTLLRALFPRSIVFDFLQTDLALELTRRPSLLRERLLARSAQELREPVILDEVQKVPAVLDEVQWLIENKSLRFVLCGSSARKLKRGRANLLGGRAWRFELFPLVTAELREPDLLRMLNRGLLPSHYASAHWRKSLEGYVVDYLKEEVFDEGLTRNVPAFLRFFEAMGWSHGELTNFANIARECGVDSKTVKEYYQILCDTLLGRFVAPYKKRQDRQLITKAAKFYLFDVGIAGVLTHRRIEAPRGEQFGRALEHLVLMELCAHASYSELAYPISFWRTKAGREVDFVLGSGEIAVEGKGSPWVDDRDVKSLASFAEEYKPRTSYLVCNEPVAREVGQIQVVHWRSFFEALWAGAVIR